MIPNSHMSNMQNQRNRSISGAENNEYMQFSQCNDLTSQSPQGPHPQQHTQSHTRGACRRWLLLAVPPWVLALSYPPLLFDKAQPCAQCAR